MKTKERLEARRLRREEGRSIKAIARRLGVAPSSVSLWVRDIELTRQQHEALHLRNGAYPGQLASAQARAKRSREIRRDYQASGRALAAEGSVLHAAGCMLFWAEGARTRNDVRFTNSDPAMVAFFVSFLRDSFALPDDRFSITCNLFADHLAAQRKIEQFWLDTLSLPRSCLKRSTVNTYSKYSQKKRQNKLPYGTCRVVVYGTAIVQSIYGSIQEYAGFDRPEWLDC